MKRRRRLHAPDDDSKPFIARWNVLIRILIVEPSVKLVARSAMDFGDFDDGTSCHPSNARISRETGLSTRTVQDAWAIMRGMGMARRVAFGVPHEHTADEYELYIPAGWRDLPVYGPHVQDFHCLHCRQQFVPQPSTRLVKGTSREKPGVAFHVRQMTFCRAPRQAKGRPAVDCFEAWNLERAAAGAPVWDKLGDEVWKLLQQARGDDW